ncbi:Interferon-induced very large GTPase 1 [Holothuria leucospilota]|uniref:Interferon-induced very large GTPase 1 n=1 Tax=Holothuria leucospilota TaxID=206669 RepID=A0A9Q1H4T9_HOLLE|nr:Interferon-induced very large GTPase 1 [Holothuria leucospilota]
MEDYKYHYNYVLQQMGLLVTSELSDIGMLRKQDWEVSSQLSSLNIVTRFLSKIRSYDYRAVSLFANLPRRENDVSCLDAVQVILNHSDDHLRQKILECMAQCNLSVPVLLPNLRENGQGVFQHWGLASIVKTLPHGGNYEDVLVSRHPFHVVLLAKFGDLRDISVPFIINKITGETQGNNTPFNFYGEVVDSVSPQLCNGLLEAVWFVPDIRSTTRTDWRLMSPMCIMYFRGSLRLNSNEFSFSYRFASMMIIFVSKESLPRLRDEIQMLPKSKQIIIAICSSKKKRKSDVTSANIKLKDFGGMNDFDIAKALCIEIVPILEKENPPSFTLNDSGLSLCVENRLQVDMSTSCRYGLQKAQEIYENFSQSKEPFFSVFKLLNQWATFSKLYKDTRWRQAEINVIDEMEKQRQKLKESRISQAKQRLSYPMQIFLDTLKQSSEKEQIYIISWLKLFFKFNVLSEMSIHEANIRSVKYEFEQTKLDLPREGKQYAEHKERYTEEREALSQLTYGVDTLLRELGQLYECRSYVNIDYSYIPDIAANMVLNGHPIEMLDGATGNLPIKWLEGVFKSLRFIVGEKKVFVISILGIQSAGKSTFLNVVFGTNFEVNAGHCTRGVSFQMVKIDSELSYEIGCQYMIIIDTEGLKPLQDFCNAANEMATFVLYFSNFTFLNIAGQTIAADIKNILEIAALAFVRMNQVNLNSDCLVVQQLVSDPTTVWKNTKDIDSLRKKIDQALKHAVSMEKIGETILKENPHIFRLLNFEGNFSSLQYFPPLWGSKPMGRPESRYSDLVALLRKQLISSIAKSEPECLHLSDLSERILDIWKAIKEEDFLFFFQNAAEVSQFNQFKEDYHQISSGFNTEMMQWKLNYLRRIKLIREGYANEEDVEEVLDAKLESQNNEICDKIKTRLKDKKYWLIRNKATYFQNDFKDRLEQSRKIVLSTCERYDAMLGSFLWRDIQVNTSKKLQQVAYSLRFSKDDSLDSIMKTFRKSWDEEINDIKSRFYYQVNDEVKQRGILSEMKNEVRDVFHDTLLEKDVKKHLTEYVHLNKLRQLLHESKFLFYAGSSKQTYANYEYYLLNQIKMLESPKLSDIAKNCIRSISSNIRTQVGADCSFVYDLFQLIKKLQGKTSSDQLSKVILHICLWMIPLVLRENITNDWEIINDNLENIRGDCYRQFLSTCKVIAKNELQTQSYFRSIVEQELVHSINIELMSSLLEEFRSTIFLSKQHLLHKILADMCHKRNFNDYITYLTNPKGFTEEWVLNYISEACTPHEEPTEKVVSIEAIAQKLIDQKIHLMQEIVEKSLLYGMKGHDIFETVFQELGRNLNLWFDERKFHAIRKSMSFSSANEFLYLFSQLITDLKGSLLTILNLPRKPYSMLGIKEWFSENAKTHKAIIENLRLCFAVCPFCPVTCDETDYHEIHRSERHLPLGLGGITHDSFLATLATDSCTALVATESRYFICNCNPSLCQHFPYFYKHYRTEHPNWYIHPDGMSEEEPINYWKWVLKEFNRHFAWYYNVTEARVPHSWKYINSGDAVASLAAKP